MDDKLTVLEYVTPLLSPDTLGHRSRIVQFGYVRLNDDRTGLLIIYRPSKIIFYPDTSMFQYMEMLAATSKGSWAYANVHSNPYEILPADAL